MATNTNTDIQTFRQFVEQRFLAADFNKLPETLGVSLRRTNITLNHPRRMELATIIKLDEVMEGALLQVIDQYQIGYDRLTVEQYKKMTIQD